MRTCRNARLALHTTLRVGGPADVLCSVRSDEVATMVRAHAHTDTPLTIIGKGSNILISDTGLRGITIGLDGGDRPRIIDENRDCAVVGFDAGMLWDDAVAYSVRRGLQGIECLSGVPGTVGAAPVQNIGCYGQQLSDVVDSLEIFDVRELRSYILSAAECGFSYRSSIINPINSTTSSIVTRVTLRLHKRAIACRTYADVIEHTKADASVKDIRRAVLKIRRTKAMLAGMVASAGSFFKTPHIEAPDFDRIRDILAEGARNQHWFWLQRDGRVKVAAGRIVERFFSRGERYGFVGLSPYHALAIVTYPGARAADVVSLARHIQEVVSDRVGIMLEPEVRLLGFENYPLMR